MAASIIRGIAMLVVIIGSTIIGTSAQCEDRIPELINECFQYVKKDGPEVPPSDACCKVLEGADIPCLCSYATPAIKAVISMDKVEYVAKYCGCYVPPGLQCGSFVVPGMA